MAKLGEITGKTRVFYSELGELEFFHMGWYIYISIFCPDSG